jgi:hypothetical protein
MMLAVQRKPLIPADGQSNATSLELHGNVTLRGPVKTEHEKV